MKVCKFGGSSLANADQIRKVCDIILSDPERRIVVVSAPGKMRKSEMKITDLLIAYGNARLNDYNGKQEFSMIMRRFGSICQALDLPPQISEEISAIIEATNEQQNRLSSLEYLDTVKATGERCNAILVAAFLRQEGFEARFLDPREAGLLLSDEHGNADVLPESYENLAKLRSTNEIIVFPGFYGYTPEGKIVTFSRGGSDITGSILASAIDAEVYEIWTDVDSVYSVNPDLISEPHRIGELSYREMRELSYIGANIVHPEAMMPVYHKGIPIHILNTNNPDASGTRVVRHRTNFDGVLTGIAGSKHFTSLNISDYLMNRKVGIVASILNVLSEENVSFEHMPTSIDSVSIILRDENFPPEVEQRVVQRIRTELGLADIEVYRGLALVMLVGEAMKDTVGVTARAITALSRASVSLEMMIQDHSEMSVIFIVDSKFCNYSVETLYHEFFTRQFPVDIRA